MRKVINLCLLVVTILLSGAVNAAGKVSVEITNSSVINVSLTKVLKGEKLILKDFYGEVLFNTTLETSSNYQKNFNLSNVPLGLYFVESESLYEIKITPILKNNKRISLIDTSLVTFFKPQVSSENSIVKVLLNNTRNYPVDIIIYDEDQVVLEEIEGNKEASLKRVYDFSEMPKGEYKLFFTLKDRTFIHNISI